MPRVGLGDTPVFAGIALSLFLNFWRKRPGCLGSCSVIIASGIVEIVLGLALVSEQTLFYAGWAVAALFVAIIPATFPNTLIRLMHRLNTDSPIFTRLFFEPALVIWSSGQTTPDGLCTNDDSLGMVCARGTVLRRYAICSNGPFPCSTVVSTSILSSTPASNGEKSLSRSSEVLLHANGVCQWLVDDEGSFSFEISKPSPVVYRKRHKNVPYYIPIYGFMDKPANEPDDIYHVRTWTASMSWVSLTQLAVPLQVASIRKWISTTSSLSTTLSVAS